MPIYQNARLIKNIKIRLALPGTSAQQLLQWGKFAVILIRRCRKAWGTVPAYSENIERPSGVNEY